MFQELIKFLFWILIMNSDIHLLLRVCVENFGLFSTEITKSVVKYYGRKWTHHFMVKCFEHMLVIVIKSRNLNLVRHLEVEEFRTAQGESDRDGFHTCGRMSPTRQHRDLLVLLKESMGEIFCDTLTRDECGVFVLKFIEFLTADIDLKYNSMVNGIVAQRTFR